MKKFTFRKYERLRLRTHFKTLQQKGKKLKANSLRAFFYIEPYKPELFPKEYFWKVAFIVPKKKYVKQ